MHGRRTLRPWIHVAILIAVAGATIAVPADPVSADQPPPNPKRKTAPDGFTIWRSSDGLGIRARAADRSADITGTLSIVDVATDTFDLQFSADRSSFTAGKGAQEERTDGRGSRTNGD